MTIEEFNKTRFGTNMRARYDSVDYKVVSVNFTESLIGLVDVDDTDDIFWVRCENAELI